MEWRTYIECSGFGLQSSESVYQRECHSESLIIHTICSGKAWPWPLCVCLRGLACIMGCAAVIEIQIRWMRADRPAKELQCCALIWLKCTQRIEMGEVENVPVILLIRVSLSLDGLKIFPMLEITASQKDLIEAFILNDTFSFVKFIYALKPRF